jgi:hypothetical protein
MLEDLTALINFFLALSALVLSLRNLKKTNRAQAADSKSVGCAAFATAYMLTESDGVGRGAPSKEGQPAISTSIYRMAVALVLQSVFRFAAASGQSGPRHVGPPPAERREGLVRRPEFTKKRHFASQFMPLPAFRLNAVRTWELA